MKRFLLLAGCVVLWSNVVLVQGALADLIFEDGFENHPDAVEILSLTANPSSVYEGESTTISWVLKDADSCVATDGTPEWRASVFNGTDGNFDVTTLTTQGLYPFTLTCTGLIGEDAVDTVNFEVSVAPTCALPTLDAGINISWPSFWGQDYPNSGGPAVSQAINDGHYLSVQFDTGAVVNNGRVLTLDTSFTSATRLGTISRCPGRFEASSECTHTWVDGQADPTGINWATDGEVGACALLPNTTYFLNVTFTNGLNSNTDSCISEDCIVTIKHDLDPVDP